MTTVTAWPTTPCPDCDQPTIVADVHFASVIVDPHPHPDGVVYLTRQSYYRDVVDRPEALVRPEGEATYIRRWNPDVPMYRPHVCHQVTTTAVPPSEPMGWAADCTCGLTCHSAVNPQDARDHLAQIHQETTP